MLLDQLPGRFPRSFAATTDPLDGLAGAPSDPPLRILRGGGLERLDRRVVPDLPEDPREVPAVLFVIGGLFAIWEVARHIDPLAPECIMNGLGAGHCTFTNKGVVPDRVCGTVVLTGPSSAERRSTAFCSGFVWPGSSAQVNFDIVDTSRSAASSRSTLTDGRFDGASTPG